MDAYKAQPRYIFRNLDTSFDGQERIKLNKLKFQSKKLEMQQ